MMICKNCSFENADDAQLCANCEAPLNQNTEQENKDMPLEETNHEKITDPETTDDTDQQGEADVKDEPEPNLDADQVSDSSSEAGAGAEAPKQPSEQPKKKRPFYFAFSGLIALTIICIGLWILFTGVFSPKYDLPIDRSRFDVLYTKDDKLYARPLSRETRQLSEALSADSERPIFDLSDKIVQSRDGKTTYFLEGYDETSLKGTLYVSYNNKDKVQIATDVAQGFGISPDGKSVLYITNMDDQTSSGNLYLYRQGGSPEFIAEKSVYRGYMFSDNGKAIAYLDNYDPSAYTGELYFKPLGGEAVKVDDDVLGAYRLTNKSEILYTKNFDMQTYLCDYYYWIKGKDPELITEGVNERYLAASPFSAKSIYLKPFNQPVVDFLLKEPGKPEQTVAEDIMGFFALDIENENYLLAKSSDPQSRTPDVYLKKKGKEPVEIAQNLVYQSHCRASLDYNTIVYIDEYDQETNMGKLHVRTDWFGFVNDKVIAENVYMFATTPDAKTIAYITNPNDLGMGSLYVYRGGKSRHIANGVGYNDFSLSPNGKAIIYLSDINTSASIGNLYVAKTSNGKSSAIDSNVQRNFYSRSDKNAIYMKNFNLLTSKGDLYIWKGSGEPELIDTDVKTVMFETKFY